KRKNGNLPLQHPNPKEMRLLSLDIGSKRIGVAVYNPRSKLVRPLPILHRRTLRQDLVELTSIIQREEIEGLVVGVPLSLEGKITDSTKNALFWVDTLKTKQSLPVFTCDESLSTREAIQVLKHQGAKSKKDKIDSFAAALFL